MLNWEKILESLRGRGWSYGYSKCQDDETGSEIFLVNLGRGETRLSIRKDTLEEAVAAINRLARKER